MTEMYLNEVLLPVTPGAISLKIKNQNKTVSLVDGTEYNVIKPQGLTEISFDCMLPAFQYPFTLYEGGIYREQTYYLGLFENLKIGGRNFYLRIVRNDGLSEGLPINCTLEDYTIKEDAKEGFDITVSLKLKQYVAHKTEVINISDGGSSNGVKSATVESQRPVDKTAEDLKITIREGDTLWGLAKRYLGDGGKYTAIYNDNADIIESAAKKNGYGSSSNGYWIFPGTEVTIKGAIK